MLQHLLSINWLQCSLEGPEVEKGAVCKSILFILSCCGLCLWKIQESSRGSSMLFSGKCQLRACDWFSLFCCCLILFCSWQYWATIHWIPSWHLQMLPLACFKIVCIKIRDYKEINAPLVSVVIVTILRGKLDYEEVKNRRTCGWSLIK